MSSAGETLRTRIQRAVTLTRRQAGMAVALGVAAVIPAALLLAWGVGESTFRAAPLAIVIVGAVGAVGLAAGLIRAWVLSVDERVVAAAAERARGLPDGSLRVALELGRELPAGVSPELLHYTERELAAQLAVPAPELAGEVGRRTRRRRGRALGATAALLVVVGAVALAAPDRARAAWAPLLSPRAHLAGAVLPALEVAPGDTSVDRGSELTVTVRAPLRRRVTVQWRAIGDVPGVLTLAVAESEAIGAVGPVHAPTDYWVSAPDGAVTDTFRVDPRDPLMVGDLAIDVLYPDHTGQEAEHYAGNVPSLRIPEGTLLRLRGRVTRQGAAAALVRDDGAVRTVPVDSGAFAVEWRPAVDASGTWGWRLTEGELVERPVEPSVDLTVVPDEAPDVRVTVPGADTLMPRSMRLPVVADASDDHGVAAGTLVFRRRGGGDPVETAFPAPPSASRVLLRGVLDASALGLVPGDVVEYHVVVTDNSPAEQTARSATYTLRLPGAADLRAAARGDATALLDAARRLAERTRSLGSATRDLSRSARNGARGELRSAARSSDSEPLSFDDASAARAVVDEHESVLAEAREIRDRLAELERAVAESGLRDPELRHRLAELRELYARVTSPELREAMGRLRDATESLDAGAVREALERLTERQEEFGRQVEASLEMMRRAVAEQEMSALARDADEIASQQEALSASVEEDAERGAPMEGRARQQEELAGRAGNLSTSLTALRAELRELGERGPSTAAEEAGERSRTARAAMEEALGDTRRQGGEGAARSGRSAAQELRSAARTLAEARSTMAQTQGQAAQESVQQATREALELAEREEVLRRRLEEARRQGGLSAGEFQQVRSEQAALQQSLDQLGGNLSETDRQSGTMDRQVGQALERARRDMQQTADGLVDEGSPVPVEGAGEAVESLNQLAMSLMEHGRRLRQTAQGGEGAQRVLERLGELARDQAVLNGLVGALAPMGLAREALERQLEALARRQEGIADGMGAVSDAMDDPDDALGQLDAMARDAEEIARDLEGGRLDPEVRARQERLFQRLLDAGRSLEGSEYSDERVGERAEGGTAQAPAPLAPALLDAGLRYPVPTAEQLSGLPPGYRALILEYFDLLNRTAGDGDPVVGTGDGSGGDG